MYKKNHDNRQRRADAIHLKDMPSQPADRTDAERREDCRARLRQINAAIPLTPHGPEREKLNAEKFQLEQEVRAIPRPIVKADLGSLIIDELKKMVSHGQYRLAVKMASDRFAAGETNAEMEAKKGQKQ